MSYSYLLKYKRYYFIVSVFIVPLNVPVGVIKCSFLNKYSIVIIRFAYSGFNLVMNIERNSKKENVRHK